MDYQKAKDIRGKKFSELMTDKLLEGQGVGSALSKTLSERSKARFTGIKQAFDPLNIAKVLTGGSRLGPALLGKITGASKERMSFFAGDPKKKKVDALSSAISPQSLQSATESLGNIYTLLKQDMENKKLQREQMQSKEEEQESEEERRNKELIKALTARVKPKAKVRKEEREEKEIRREAEEKAAPPPIKKPEAPKAPAPKAPEAPKVPAPKAPAPPAPKPTAAPAPKAPAVPKVTKAQKVAKGAAIAGALAAGAGLVTAALTSAGLSKKAQANVLAQVEAESGFKPRSENLNYTSAERIQKTFGTGRIPSIEYAQTLVGNPEKLAEAVYGKDTAAGKRLGNTEPGDGWKYRGRGFLQHTGKGQYIEIKKYTGIDVVNNPDLLNDPEVAAKAIPWFFLSYKKLKPADLENISTVNRAVGFSDPSGEKAIAREKLSLKYADKDLNVPAVSSTGTQIDSASKENKELKKSLNKDKPAQTVVNNANVVNETESAYQTPETVVDDRPILLKKKG